MSTKSNEQPEARDDHLLPSISGKRYGSISPIQICPTVGAARKWASGLTETQLHALGLQRLAPSGEKAATDVAIELHELGDSVIRIAEGAMSGNDHWCEQADRFQVLGYSFASRHSAPPPPTPPASGHERCGDQPFEGGACPQCCDDEPEPSGEEWDRRAREAEVTDLRRMLHAERDHSAELRTQLAAATATIARVEAVAKEMGEARYALLQPVILAKCDWFDEWIAVLQGAKHEHRGSENAVDRDAVRGRSRASLEATLKQVEALLPKMQAVINEPGVTDGTYVRRATTQDWRYQLVMALTAHPSTEETNG